jgi:hypothetical protein
VRRKAGSHFALRTSHFALRTSHFAIRTSQFALITTEPFSDDDDGHGDKN